MIITYLITTLPDISHELTFGYTPRLLCLYLGDVVYVVKNEALVELSHEREVMEKGQVKPHVGVAESTRDLLERFESNVLMKEIVHGIWVTAQNIWCPLLQSKNSNSPKHELQVSLGHVLDVVGDNPAIWQRFQKFLNQSAGIMDMARVLVKTSSNG